jgi:superoxide dismutase, Fe-Mn family
MPTFEEISPRPLDPRLLQLSGISRASVEAHYRLYQGYVGKRNEILAALDGVDLEKANQVYSEVRSLKVDLSFAIGGIKNHELYFAHLGGQGGDPDGAFSALVERDFGSVEAWRKDLKATGIAGRGWAWTAPVQLPR